MEQNIEIDYKKLFAPKDFKAHWNEEIKVQEYHADKTAVNSSSLKKMIKSPLAFHNAFYGVPEEPTDAMKMGTLAHLAILQGDLFRKKYIVMPEFESKTADGKLTDSKNTKYYKQQVEEWVKSVPEDAIVVTAQEREDLFRMIDAIVSNEMAFKLLSDGKPEICGYWRDPETGILCRMQADFLGFKLGALVDVKTCQDSSWPEFRRNVENYEYAFQMAMYREGIKHITGKLPDHTLWLAIEKKAPFEVRVYEMSPHYEAIGDYNYRAAIRKLKESIDSGKFLGGQSEIEIAEPSYWYFKQYEDKGIFTNI